MSRPCDGKKLYLAKDKADHAAKQTRRLRETPHVAYHCNHCHGWHVGSNTAKGKLRGRK